MIIVFVIVVVGIGILVAAIVRVQVRRQRNLGVRQSVSTDPIQVEVPVHVKPMVQLGIWGKTLSMMQMQIRERSLSIIASFNGRRLGSALGSEWYFVGSETTMRQEQIDSPLGNTWIALSTLQGGKRVEVAVRPKVENTDVRSALLKAGVHVGDAAT